METPQSNKEKMAENNMEDGESFNKYTKNCVSCKSTSSPEEKALTFFENDRVKVVLREDNQCWLGRCIIVPKQHISPKDLYGKRIDVLTMLASVISMLNDVYKDTFGMTISNIAQLGNLTVDELGNKTCEDGYFHFHLHFIPRYKDLVMRYGHEFKDPQWGQALNIDPKSGLPVFKPSAEMIAAIKADLQKGIDKYISTIASSKSE